MTNFIECKELTLQSAIGTSDTTIVVTGAYRYDGTIITEADFGGAGAVMYATIEPKTDRQESLACVWVSNVAGVMTMTVTRALSGVAPYSTGGVAYSHSAGSVFIFANSAALFNKLTAKDNNEAVTGAWTFPDPTANQHPVTKKYFDDNGVKLTGAQTVAGVKTFSSAPKIPDATAADEALTKGQSDTIEATNVKLTGNQAIGGVKTFSLSPKIPNATAADEPMTKGQHDADAAASSAVASPTVRGSAKLDTTADDPADPKVLTATVGRIGALVGSKGTPSSTNKFITEDGYIDIQEFTANGSWTKPSGATYIEVFVWGGGGGGSRVTSFSAAGGGGGGGFSRAFFPASSVSTTETITVGTGGAAATGGPTHGGDGNYSSFGTKVFAYGGKGGRANDPSTTATTFVAGGTPFAVGSTTSATVPTSLDIFVGGWGGGMIASVGYAGTKSMYGGGGGGCANGNAAGGISYSGGNGGAGGFSQNAVNGSVPGGGGGGCSTTGAHTAGSGGDGKVIVISHF